MYIICRALAPIGWNEMPFGGYSCVVPSNIVLDRGSSPPWEGGFGGLNLQSEFALQIVASITGSKMVTIDSL